MKFTLIGFLTLCLGFSIAQATVSVNDLLECNSVSDKPLPPVSRNMMIVHTYKKGCSSPSTTFISSNEDIASHKIALMDWTFPDSPTVKLKQLY